MININYRVKVENILPADTVVVYKYDFGDISFLTLDALRPLPSEFRQIPQLAIPAKLHGITNFFDKLFPIFLKSQYIRTGIQPKNNVWNNDDTAFFQKLTVQKQFAASIKAIRKESGNQSYVLEMVLIDVSTAHDIIINDELVKQQHANFL